MNPIRPPNILLRQAQAALRTFNTLPSPVVELVETTVVIGASQHAAFDKLRQLLSTFNMMRSPVVELVETTVTRGAPSAMFHFVEGVLFHRFNSVKGRLRPFAPHISHLICGIS